jgi:hypothetical protein
MILEIISVVILLPAICLLFLFITVSLDDGGDDDEFERLRRERATFIVLRRFAGYRNKARKE